MKNYRLFVDLVYFRLIVFTVEFINKQFNKTRE
jgi:hypothetical protein